MYSGGHLMAMGKQCILSAVCDHWCELSVLDCAVMPCNVFVLYLEVCMGEALHACGRAHVHMPKIILA